MSIASPTRRRPTGLILSLALCIGLSASATPAVAFNLFGLKLFEGNSDQAEDVIGEPQTYSVDFTVSGDHNDLTKSLKGASNLWADREKPASGVAGLISKARGDYKRLLDTLYADARYGPTISITIEGQEASELAPDAQLSDPTSVRLSIDPGPQFRFDEVRVLSQAPPPTDTHDEVDRPEDEGFVPGEIARSGTIIKAARLSVEAWRQQGHAKAEVAEQRVVAAHRSDTIDATLDIHPGRKAYYGPVTVEGTDRLDPDFIAYMTGLEPGQEYDPDDITEAGDRLARLDVFRSQRIVEADELDPNGILPIEVVVQERLPHRFGVGGSYSTIDGLGLEAYWLHRNLFGRAERLRFDAKVAGIGETIDPTEFTYHLGATFTKPGVFTPDTDFIASLSGDREVLDAYTRTGVTASAGFKRQFTKELSGRAFVNAGYNEFEDDLGTRDYLTTGVLGALTYDSRDNAANATEGFYLEGIVEPFYEFEYGNVATRMTAEGRTYYGFGEENRVVLAGRLKVGSIVGPSILETPPDKLFFAGGGGSVRGYGYRTIGVPTAGGLVGGRSLIEGSAEVRMRFTDSIGAVAFADAGYVGADSIPDFGEDLKIGVGAGLRYITGLGPIRFDVAMPLDPGPDDPDVAFYVGIGQAF